MAAVTSGATGPMEALSKKMPFSVVWEKWLRNVSNAIEKPSFCPWAR